MMIVIYLVVKRYSRFMK